MKKAFLYSLIVFAQYLSAPAEASWSWGLGYHNPPGASLGFNFMHLWSNWAFEAGLGYIGSNENATKNSQEVNSDTTTSSKIYAGGDLNLKYLFSSGLFRPYLQAGTGSAISIGNTNNSQNDSNNTGANASLNTSFAGAGFFLLGSEFYIYLSYLTTNSGTLQFGVGFN